MTELTERGKQIRRDTLKLGGSGICHDSFSIIEILIALYDHVIDENDTVLISKGHCSIPQTVIISERTGDGIFSSGGFGCDMTTSTALALTLKTQSIPGRVYVIVDDSEVKEGAFWESLLLAGRSKLDNLTVIVTSNLPEDSDCADDTLPISDIAISKIAMYANWASIIIDGHHIDTVRNTLDWTLTLSVPSLIIANTVKGRGVSFMENRPEWREKFPPPDEIEQAYGELQ